MEQLLGQINVRVNDKIYLKDPESSELGKKLVRASIRMIHSMGLEAFTFKKLAIELGTTESTVYRYFENKHKLLIYLISWYWGWLEYEMVFQTMNIADPQEKLKKTTEVISDPLREPVVHHNIDLKQLYDIIIGESPKAFLTKEVDRENKDGYFSCYKRISERITKIIEEINPEFRFSRTLASTLLESAIQQRFFAQHLPSLCSIDKNGAELGHFLSDMALKTVKPI